MSKLGAEQTLLVYEAEDEAAHPEPMLELLKLVLIPAETKVPVAVRLTVSPGQIDVSSAVKVMLQPTVLGV